MTSIETAAPPFINSFTAIQGEAVNTIRASRRLILRNQQSVRCPAEPCQATDMPSVTESRLRVGVHLSRKCLMGSF